MTYHVFREDGGEEREREVGAALSHDTRHLAGPPLM